VKPILQLLTLSIGILSTPIARAAEPAPVVGGVITEVVLEVGRPAAMSVGAAAGVMRPLTVVVYEGQGLSAVERLVKLQLELRESYRLESLEKVGSATLNLAVDESQAAPAPIKGLNILLKLVGADDIKATYEVRLVEKGKEPVVTSVAVKRSQWAIVGGRDGEEAPYFFVLFRPLTPDEEKEEARWKGMTRPKVITKVTPAYPEEERQARAQDVVVLELDLRADGTVAGATPIQGKVPSLVEAARQAAMQWVYEPARDAAGKPVACKFTVTIVFKLH